MNLFSWVLIEPALGLERRRLSHETLAIDYSWCLGILSIGQTGTGLEAMRWTSEAAKN